MKTAIIGVIAFSSLLALNSEAQQTQKQGDSNNHEPSLQSKVDFIAEYDENNDGKVNHSEFFSSRQKRLSAMDLRKNAQVTVIGYQAEYADRLDARLASDRIGQLKQTEIRFAAVDKNQDGTISAEEYIKSGQSAFAFIDKNKDGVISELDSVQSKRAYGKTSDTKSAKEMRRRPALVMPTTHSIDGMVAMYDVDKNGSVTESEYLCTRQQVFARTDTDKSGELSPIEYMDEFTDRVDQQIAKTREAQLKQALVRFKALDKDENGILSAVEFHQSGQQIFARWDTDKNLSVTLAEQMPVAIAKSDKETKQEKTAP